MGFMDKVFNRRIKKDCFIPYCTILAGERRSGKSTLFALIAKSFLAQGYDVYCQYPYEGVFRIPMKEYISKQGMKRYDIDREWLYTADLHDCVILLDECKTIWPARNFANWTQSDEDFFNFLGKNNVHLFLATQQYDGLDLNVKRNADALYFITPGFWHFTHVESSKTVVAKIADKNTEVLGRLFKKGMRQVVYGVCEVPLSHYRFWRKSYYGDFITLHTYEEKVAYPKVLWSTVIDFKTGEPLARTAGG